MSLTITIPGAVNVTTGAMAPAVLTIGVGVPGAQGPAGPAGPGVPVGGSAGQYLQKIDGTNYNTDWVTLNLAAYAPLSSPTFTGDPQAPTPATSDNDTSIATTAFVKAQGFLTSAPVTSVAGRTGAITLSNTDISGLGTMSTASASNYSTTAVADTLYAPIAAGLPVAGTTGQVLTKNSGTNYDSSWATLIPGDRYLTSSTTSNTVSNGTKSFTIGTGLSYTPTQNITISYDASNHMHGEVLTYNSGTGVLTVDVNHHTGSGTYTAWVVNVGGVTPATSVAWGSITGTLSAQTDLQSALDAKLAVTTAASTYAPLASPSFTGLATFDNPGNYAISVPASGVGYDIRIEGQLITMRNASTEVIRISPGGIKYPDGVTQTVAFPGSSGFLLKADNLSGLGNTATARTNLGLGTMAVETASNYLTTATAASTYQPISGMSSYLTSSTAASTYFTIASAANKADLASPALTGTPTAPTAAAATNTTQIATTAFVQQEVPAASTTAAGKVELATNAEVITSTATNLAIVPASLPFAITDPRLRSMAHISFTKVSGSGAVTAGSVPFGIREMYLGSLATGLAGFSYGWTGQQAVNMSSSDWSRVNFSKKVWMSGTAMCGATLGATDYIGDSNTRNRITLGGYTSDNVSGDMTVKGIGWKKVGGTSPFFTLTVHNGTTLTDVASTITQSAGKVISWMIYSDGTGNVTLYIDGVQAATTSAGPTGTTNANQATYREQVEAVATPTVRGIMECSGGAIYIEP